MTSAASKPALFILAILMPLWICTPVQAAQKLLISSFVASPLTDIAENTLRTAYKKLGIEIEIVHMPGERSIKMANQGKMDGDLMRIANIDTRYANLLCVPVAIAQTETVVFSKKTDLAITDWQSLKPYNIGIQIGHKLVEQRTRDMKTVSVSKLEQGFRMLEQERIDVFIGDRLEGLALLKKMHLSDIHDLQPALSHDSLFHYLNKKHRALVPQLTEALRQMEESGEIRQQQQQTLDAYLPQTD